MDWVDKTALNQIAAGISPERFATYKVTANGDDGAALRLYAWNLAVSAALWAPLGVLEVRLRNGLHERLWMHFSRADWWDHPAVVLAQPQQRKLDDARTTLGRRNIRQPLPGQIVAELPFGFWVGLLGRGANYERQFWQHALQRALPGYRGPRQPVYRHLDRLRVLRNRIAHHEPLIARDLGTDHADLLTAASWLCPATRDWLAASSRVPSLLSRRSTVVAGTDPKPFMW